MKAPVRFLGIQPAPAPMEPMELYNLTSPILGVSQPHGAGSTISRRDIERAGYQIPEDEAAKASQAMADYRHRTEHMAYD